MEKREIKQEEKKGLELRDLLLTAVLLAAGAVLKFFVGSLITVAGMKPNFVIAMYCMVIVLLRPKIWYSIIVGLLAGAICQFFPGTPLLNFASEFAGALCMGLLIMIPTKNKPIEIVLAAISTFISTIISGGLYTVLLFIKLAEPGTIAAYAPIVLGTATLNAVIVAILYTPLMKAIKKPFVCETNKEAA